MNSYSIDIFGGWNLDHDQVIYQPGDFIIHFPSTRGVQLYMLMQKYSELAMTSSEVKN
jgi:hypothetical protein